MPFMPANELNSSYMLFVVNTVRYEHYSLAFNRRIKVCLTLRARIFLEYRAFAAHAVSRGSGRGERSISLSL